jgi:hypothetical protein
MLIRDNVSVKKVQLDRDAIHVLPSIYEYPNMDVDVCLFVLPCLSNHFADYSM